MPSTPEWLLFEKNLNASKPFEHPSHECRYLLEMQNFPSPKEPVAPVAQRYHVTSDTLGREFDPGKRDFSH